MPPRRAAGLGAMRQIRARTQRSHEERKDLDQRIRRLRAAEAALYGGRSPNAKVLNREQLRSYLAEHPGSRSLEIADALGVPPGSVRTLLQHDEEGGRSPQQKQRWYLAERDRLRETHRGQRDEITTTARGGVLRRQPGISSTRHARRPACSPRSRGCASRRSCSRSSV